MCSIKLSTHTNPKMGTYVMLLVVHFALVSTQSFLKIKKPFKLLAMIMTWKLPIHLVQKQKSIKLVSICEAFE